MFGRDEVLKVEAHDRFPKFSLVLVYHMIGGWCVGF